MMTLDEALAGVTTVGFDTSPGQVIVYLNREIVEAFSDGGMKPGGDRRIRREGQIIV